MRILFMLFLFAFHSSFSQSVLGKTKSQVILDYQHCITMSDNDTLLLKCGNYNSIFLFKKDVCVQTQSEMSGQLFNELRMKVVEDPQYKQAPSGDTYTNGTITYTFLPTSLSGQHNGLFTIVINNSKYSIDNSQNKVDSIEVKGIVMSCEAERIGINGNYVAAVAMFTKVINLNLKDTLWHNSAYWQRGRFKSYMGNYAGAIQDFNKCNCLSGIEGKADIEFKLQNFQIAIIDYTIVINGLSPDGTDGNVFRNRGIAKIKTGQREGGCLDLSHAADLGDIDAQQAIIKYCQ